MIHFASNSQSGNSSIVITAFEKTSIPGISKKVAIEGDSHTINVENKPRKRNIEIFLEHNKNQTIKPVYVWMQGKAFSIKAEKLSGPVLSRRNLIGNNIEVDTLVKVSDNPVWILVPTSIYPKSIKSKKGVPEDQIILVYTLNGKSVHSKPIKIQQLPGDILQ